MSQRTKLLIAGTALAAVLGLTAVTNAWFISLSKTPAGVVHAALVRCLPESGPKRDTDSLLTYGSLVSGSGVDTDGVPLVLPGDSLLSMQTWANGSRTVRTSLARDFQADETPGTVIHRVERTGADGATATRTQRDLMHTGETSLWYNGSTATGDPINDPELNPSNYTAVTTADTTVEEITDPAPAKTITTVTLTTVYTPRTEGALSYTHVQQTIEEVTHEAAAYVPDQGTYDAIKDPARTLSTDETVLSVDGEKTVTHSYLIITETPTDSAGSAAADPVPLPMALGNLSTADVRIRVGLNATITRTEAGGTKTIVPLVLKPGNTVTDPGVYFLGLTDTSNNFIELFRFQPADPDGYHWAQSPDTATDAKKSSAWSLFDLTLDATAEGADPLDIPPPVAPAPSPTPTPDPSATPVPAPTAAPVEAEPDLYRVLDVLRVVSRSSFNVDKTVFEKSFNELYCTNAPTIRLSIHYYVRQSEYMAWSEFYSDSLSFTVPTTP